ncbi:MAG TPA: hypothetical protein DEB24_03445 [Coriobacteriia bacterium]|nr:hypothetical protein [Coriobacteriia bacterium]
MSAEEKSYDALTKDSVDVARLPLSELTKARDLYGESLDGHTAMPGQQVITGQRACTYFLWLNLKNETLSDLRIRKAISHAIDREALCKEALAGTGMPAGDMIPAVIKGSRDNAWKDTEFNVEKARSLLREYRDENPSNGVELHLLISDTVREAFYDMIRDNLESVGFVVRKKQPQSTEEYETFRGGPALMFSGWIADFLDMENFLTPLFGTGGGANDMGYENPAFDTMVAKARAALNEPLRIAAYQRADDMVAEDMAVVPLYYPTLDIVCSDRVNDLYVAPDEIADLRKAWVTL